jgi:hypothetical protein
VHHTDQLVPTGWPPRDDDTAEHHVLYRRDDEFAAWPFYCGLWLTADGSLVAGFKRVPTDYRDIDHYNLVGKPGEIVVIRSRDGGRTWDDEDIVPVFDMSITREEDLPGGASDDWGGLPPLDFTNRDTLVMGGGIPRMMSRDGARAWVRASADGGRTWRPHRLLPNWDLPGVTMPGTSSYAVRPDGVMLFGMHAWAPGGQNPLPVVYASQDGAEFGYLGQIVPDAPPSPYWPGGKFASAKHIYPRLAVLADGRVLASLRYERDPRGLFWTEIHESLDGGRTWRWLSRVNDWGAPGDLVPLQDGRVLCIYGYRLAPRRGIRYRISEDQGRTWGTEMILRDDGATWDLGYPRAVEVEPGVVLTHYWMNLAEPGSDRGGVRHIACTRFRP